jgi:hypothetical protein
MDEGEKRNKERRSMLWLKHSAHRVSHRPISFKEINKPSKPLNKINKAKRKRKDEVISISQDQDSRLIN